MFSRIWRSALVAMVTGALGFAAGAYAAKGKELIISSAGEAKFAPIDPNNAAGPQVAWVYGDPKKGGAFFLKLPVGFNSGLHTHSSDYHAVGLTGSWKHWAEGKEADAKPMSNGYVFQPGKGKHADACEGSECLAFIVVQGKFDFVPVPAPKEMKKAEAAPAPAPAVQK